jgi:hypothetical protein
MEHGLDKYKEIGALKKIPQDIVVYLLSSFCNPSDICAFERCSKGTQQIANKELIWRNLVIRESKEGVAHPKDNQTWKGKYKDECKSMNGSH